MTSPRPYGGAYHSSPSFADTPIYDRLVAERGTPQIAPIRVPSAYEPLGYAPAGPPQPALPALPALPAGPSQPQPARYAGHQMTPTRQPRPAPMPGGMSGGMSGGMPGGASGAYVPQQATAARPYPAPQPPQAPMPQQMRPAAPRPAAPRPAAPQQMPGGYQHPYPGQQQPYPTQGYWAEQPQGQ